MTGEDATTRSTAIRDLCEEFIAVRYAHELEYVPLLWDALHDHAGRTSPMDPGDLCAGLSFAADVGAPLVAPFVLLTLEATLRELSDRGLSPDLVSISEAVRKAAEALGASTKLIEELKNDLPPRLAAMFSADDGALSLAEPGKIGASPPDHLYIDRYVDGHTRKLGWARKKVRTENRKNERYDIVVDEIARDVLIRTRRDSSGEQQPKPIRMDDIDPRVATMLWFVLRYFGESISFKDLRIRMNLDESGAQDNGIHKAKSDLTKMLGERTTEKLFGRALHKRYSVRADGVNYCWMRLTDNPNESELLYRAGAPGE